MFVISVYTVRGKHVEGFVLAFYVTYKDKTDTVPPGLVDIMEEAMR